MKLLIQRVNRASVTIDQKPISHIDTGLLVFLGITHTDSESEIDYLVKKLVNLRIFEDDNQKMNLSVLDIKGSILIVSQFTLYADSSRGNRPDFIQAAKPEIANSLYEKFIDKVMAFGINTKSGVFGGDMVIDIENNGPVTIMIEK